MNTITWDDMPLAVIDIIMKTRWHLMIEDNKIRLFDNVICELMDIRLKKDVLIYDIMVQRRQHHLFGVQISLSFNDYFFLG